MSALGPLVIFELLGRHVGGGPQRGPRQVSVEASWSRAMPKSPNDASPSEVSKMLDGLRRGARCPVVDVRQGVGQSRAEDCGTSGTQRSLVESPQVGPSTSSMTR